MSARLVARDNGLIAVATGSGAAYGVLKQGTVFQGNHHIHPLDRHRGGHGGTDMAHGRSLTGPVRT